MKLHEGNQKLCHSDGMLICQQGVEIRGYKMLIKKMQLNLDSKEAIKLRAWILVNVIWKGQDQTCIMAVYNDLIFAQLQCSAGDLLL